MLIDHLAKIALMSTNQFLLIALVTIGYYSTKRLVFCRALFILLFTMILNPYLKSLWQIPLGMHLGKVGFAFPSGHMQMATAFFGWLALEFYTFWFFAFTTVLLMGVGFALIHFGYHNFIDVEWAAIFALLTLIIYSIICEVLKNQKVGIIGIVLAIFSLFLIILIPPLPYSSIWLAWGALLGFSLGSLYIEKPFKTSLKKQIAVISVAFLGATIIYLLFSWRIIHDLFSPKIGFVQFFILAFWISFGAYYCVFKIRK